MEQRDRTSRPAVAVVATVVVLLGAFLTVGVGFNMYMDDYCATAMAQPEGVTSVSGQRFANPITIECRFDNVGWVSQTDARPLLYTIGVIALVAAFIGAMAVWARGQRGSVQQVGSTSASGR